MSGGDPKSHDREGYILRALITGGAGFIGSATAKALVNSGWEVVVYDNFSFGSHDNLAELAHGSRSHTMKVIVGDCIRLKNVKDAIRDCDAVFHFAANPEVRMELSTPEQCFTQNVIATQVVLEAFRESRANTIVFASTSTVYGDAKTLPTPEEYGPLTPISIYGASKLAGEALVGSYCRAFDKHGIILRLANVIGPRSKHGVVSEFVAKLDKNPNELSIMGGGTQKKSYIYIDDCVNGIMATIKHPGELGEVFNLGSDDSMSVKEIGTLVARTMGLKAPHFRLDGGLPDGRGWIGDVKMMLLDVTRLKSIGWSPKLNSREAVEETVKQIMKRRDAQ